MFFCVYSLPYLPGVWCVAVQEINMEKVVIFIGLYHILFPRISEDLLSIIESAIIIVHRQCYVVRLIYNNYTYI